MVEHMFACGAAERHLETAAKARLPEKVRAPYQTVRIMTTEGKKRGTRSNT
jgi:hypothetical protein